jgi:hypothetical protein
MWVSVDLSEAAKTWKERGATWSFVCISYIEWNCVEPGPDEVLCNDCRLSLSLSLFPSSILSLFYIYIYIYSPFFIHFLIFLLVFFLSLIFKQAKVDTLKQGYTFGWLEHAARRSANFPHTWTFLWKSCVQCSGLLFKCVPLQGASKCTADAVLMFFGFICHLFFLIVAWNS